jgi:hypothetical protein
MAISNIQFADTANELSVPIATVKAVAKVEGGGVGIIEGKPVILFEPHIFFKELRREGIAPVISDICYPVWGTKPYPRGQEAQWLRLDRASKISRTAALKSCSWGMFQILGQNYKLAGCKTLQEFVNRMFKSEDEHLVLFMNYIKNTYIDDELRARDWKGFARSYNGPLYAKNAYDKKLKAAYESFA